MTWLGSIALLFALPVSVYAAGAALRGGRTGTFSLMRSAEHAALVNFALLSLAAGALIYAFVTRDFSVEYGASYSSRDLPLAYTVAALWGGQKGSLLFWAWMLGLFSSLVVWQNRSKNRELMPYVLAVLAAVLIFFESLLVKLRLAPLAELTGAPCVLAGFGLPGDNLHAPNEHFALACFRAGARYAAAFLHEVQSRARAGTVG